MFALYDIMRSKPYAGYKLNSISKKDIDLYCLELSKTNNVEKFKFFLEYGVVCTPEMLLNSVEPEMAYVGINNKSYVMFELLCEKFQDRKLFETVLDKAVFYDNLFIVDYVLNRFPRISNSNALSYITERSSKEMIDKINNHGKPKQKEFDALVARFPNANWEQYARTYAKKRYAVLEPQKLSLFFTNAK